MRDNRDRREPLGDQNSLLLTYLFPSTPSPLQVSTANNSVEARLNVVASPNGRTVYCSKIQLYIPVGTGEGYLTQTVPTVTPNAANWSVAVQPGIAGSGSSESINFVQYECTPNSPTDRYINYDLQFSIDIQGVSATSGPFNIGIVESSSPDGVMYEDREAEFSLAKSTPTFYLQNFIASKPDNPDVPSGEFENGASIYLNWQSNGTYFKLYTSGSQEPIYKGPDTGFEISSGLSQTTTFILQAEVTGGATSTTSATGYEAIFQYASLTVKITNPDTTPKSIEASDQIKSKGDIFADGEVSAGSLNSAGSTTTGSLTVYGTGDGALTVDGGGTFAGDLSVSGSASLNEVNASGLTTLSGGLDGSGGHVSVLGEAQTLYHGQAPGNSFLAIFGGSHKASYTANTDGMVIGNVQHPSEPEHCVYWIYIKTDEMQVGDLGGHFNSMSQAASVCLPVKKGDVFTIHVIRGFSFNTTHVTFKFFPFGSGVAENATELGTTPASQELDPLPNVPPEDDSGNPLIISE